MNPARYLLLPLWTLQLATGAKAFCDNPVIGSRRLNRWGLHVTRITIAAALARSRRRRLRCLINETDRVAFDLNGYVLKRDFLPAHEFADLKMQVLGYCGPAREMIQGDTITRRIALDAVALAAMPAVAHLIAGREWRGLMRYVGSYDSEPIAYIQTILSNVNGNAPDPQTALHADTFHPTVKAWLFLTDVAEDEGPFIYVPGSHCMGTKRLAWEKGRSISAKAGPDRYSARGSLRIAAEELQLLDLPQPQVFAVPANTLIVADTSGFHARGSGAGASMRIEIWTYGRRNPFLPWTGWDLLSTPGIAERRATLSWAVRDRLYRFIGQPWAAVGRKTASTPAHPK